MAENTDLDTDMDDLESFADDNTQVEDVTSVDDTVDDTPASKPNAGADDAATALAALRADPDIAAVLAAKAKKRPLRITVGEDESETVETSDDDIVIPDAAALNALDNAGIVSTLMDLLPRAIRKDVSAALSPVVEDMRGRQQEKLKAEVKGLNAKYADLPEYKEAMIALAKQMPGLRPEEAYIMARMRAGKGMPSAAPARRSAVERPTTTVVRSSGKRTSARPGPRGFSDDLREVLDSINFEE